MQVNSTERTVQEAAQMQCIPAAAVVRRKREERKRKRERREEWKTAPLHTHMG